MLRPPAPPAIAPPWGVAMMRDLVAWVRALGVQPAALPSYRVADLPRAEEWFSAAARDGRSALIFVSDEAGGGVPAFSDGTNWRRVTDRNVVS